MSSARLKARALSVVVDVSDAEIVRGVDVDLFAGETLALVGESGSGKTAVALGLMGYARPGTRLSAGSVQLDGVDVLKLSDRERRRLCSRRMAYVPQNPGAALNPSLRIERQFADLGQTSHESSLETLFDAVGLPASRQFRRRFPHQLSGGQQQRVIIAMALARRPDIVILDEPTTGLDVTTQAQVLKLIREVQETSGAAFLYVTHDLAVVSTIADRVAVIYGGYVVEKAPQTGVFSFPRHPYTRRLLASIPRLEGERRRLLGTPGAPPGPGTHPRGCVFAPRCEFRVEGCSAPQSLRLVEPDHEVRCHRAEELFQLAPPTPALSLTALGGDDHRVEPLLQVRDLTAEYRQLRTSEVAVKGVSFHVDPGACVALVGESGSGKTTIARSIAGLHTRWTGRIVFEGIDLDSRAQKRTDTQRRHLQLVFQNPDRSLNPRHSVERIISRPIHQLGLASKAEARDRAREMLQAVRLPDRYAHRYPADLSGGERQRVAIARALAAEPKLIICDEITSALDVSVQAALLTLLEDLRSSLNLSLLFISHDLAVVRHVADKVVVIRHGEILESGAAESIMRSPTDPYTEELLAATPSAPEPTIGDRV